jgi:YidC/Oxa1 family membrane protein insertase
MEKRVLLAVFLSFLVLYAYQAIVPSPKPAQRPPATVDETASVDAPAEPDQPAPTPPPGLPPAAPSAGAAAVEPEGEPVAAVVGEEEERTITVETATVSARLSNRGATITGWKLKLYRADDDGVVDLVPAALPATVPTPFTLRAETPGTTARLNGGLYRVTVNGAPAGERIDVARPTEVTFEFQDTAGLAARKVFRFEPDGYVLSYASAITDQGRTLNPQIQWGPGLGDSIHIAGQKSSFGIYVQRPQGILYRDGSVERLDVSTIRETPIYRGSFPFAGVDDHYFIATLVQPGLVEVAYEPQTAPLPGTDLQREMMAWTIQLAEPPQDVRFFYGPKDFDVLAAVDRPLVKTIHFGMLDFLAVPLLHALKWIHGYVGNYGWAIIILTILINIVMFPLRHKSVVSMRKMQELQPQIKAIQERYAKLKATDPERQKMNQELMALYREKGVNPASGCVPMLLTMPVLFAFYALLSVAIEIRGAPFALVDHTTCRHARSVLRDADRHGRQRWCCSMRMTHERGPRAAEGHDDHAHHLHCSCSCGRRAGWSSTGSASNLLAIGQQYATNRIIGPPVVKQARPPAERRLKAAGAGRTEHARKAQP